MAIEFPIEVKDINTEGFKCNPFDSVALNFLSNNPDIVGKLVKIRPCADEYKDKTYLGLFLGDCAVSIGIKFHPDTKVLSIENSMPNPAIYVFALKKIIFGYESWWAVIKEEEDIERLITDEVIDNVWYVKALKEALNKEGESE